MDRRCEEWDIEIPSFQPIDDNVIVWRLPPLKQSAGGLIIPDTADMPNVKGLLLKMGPRAMDILRSNGIEEGHVVIFARFAGWETQDQTPEHRRHNVILMIKARDIIGSDDLLEEIESGRAKYVLSNGRYCLERKLLNGKKEKLLALAAGTSNPNEADTAKKIASRM